MIINQKQKIKQIKLMLISQKSIFRQPSEYEPSHSSVPTYVSI